MCTKWSNLEDWFIATIAVSLLAVRTVKSFLVQPCKHFDLVQIKQFKTETRIGRLHKVTVISLSSPTSPSLKATFLTSPYPLWGKNFHSYALFLLYRNKRLTASTPIFV